MYCQCPPAKSTRSIPAVGQLGVLLIVAREHTHYGRPWGPSKRVSGLKGFGLWLSDFGNGPR